MISVSARETAMSADLIALVEQLGAPRVLVVGDVMLDRYIWGDAERISQEAPVILLHADRCEERLGGASSVATLLRALGARVVLSGIVGPDANAARIRDLLSELQVEHHAVLTDSARPSTVKERYMGRAQQRHPQQILRVDYEVRQALSGPLETKLAQVMAEEIRRADLVLVSDYDKGVCTPTLVQDVIGQCRTQTKPCLADPMRGGDYRKYARSSAITPNRLEAGLATGRVLQTGEAAMEAAAQLCRELELDATIVTLDKDGMALAERGREGRLFATRPRQVYDITGAGDMVLSVLGLALAAAANYADAVRLANVAGGLEVERIGVAPITRDEILRDLKHSTAPENQKLVDRALLGRIVLERRRAGQRVAFTNGCFDLLHAGHVHYLHEARAQADLLVVGLNSDASVRRLKGPGRPINSQDARAMVLAGLQSVDYVTIFDEPTPMELLEAIRPDVLVKGADYAKDRVVGAELVESYGGRVHLAAFQEGYSTTRLLDRLDAAA
jgi:D-beta-D-heptose 7-phosphate kinase/D-beta-D-heptose 1-phosphate adenosyltransferase